MNSVELAIKMETDAIKFYREAAERTRNAVGKKMFLSVAEDEKRHIEILSRHLEGLDLTVRQASPLKNVRTIFEEMKESMMQRVEATPDELEAFRVAMDMEKEGKSFYERAVAAAPTEKERKLFEILVREEEEHFFIFQNTYSFLSDTGNWFMWQEHSIVEG
ncbi:MAG: ferritin family protein [Alphaproteobacteria bacterium]|uniref:Ferritin family protein n=1 Tax=Candidatus Nitrobium versatile TaxID=2884831 RepID=A0A953SHB4_9BACT|nr:ferritin family protein [Candidatus Nitrobium versatile]